jgi:excisionase family DNA binding protein
VTSRSGRGRWQRVLEARKQARASLGADPPGGDLYGAPRTKARPSEQPPALPPAIEWQPGDGVGVLSLGETAARLGMSRAELERMIDAGKIEALPTGYTRMIPTREVGRLSHGRC